MTLVYDGVDTFKPQEPLPRVFKSGEIVNVVIVKVAEGGDRNRQEVINEHRD